MSFFHHKIWSLVILLTLVVKVVTLTKLGTISELLVSSLMPVILTLLELETEVLADNLVLVLDNGKNIILLVTAPSEMSMLSNKNSTPTVQFKLVSLSTLISCLTDQ